MLSDPLAIYLFDKEAWDFYHKHPTEFLNKPNQDEILGTLDLYSKIHGQNLSIWIEELTDSQIKYLIRTGMNGQSYTVELFQPLPDIQENYPFFEPTNGLNGSKYVYRPKAVV